MTLNAKDVIVVFDLATMLSVTTGMLFTDIGNVYKILGYMVGEDLFTHQLPRVSGEMRPIFLSQHPQLKDVDASDVDTNNWKEFLDEQIIKFGNEFPVIPCGLLEHRFIEPLEELESMVDPDKIFIWVGEK